MKKALFAVVLTALLFSVLTVGSVSASYSHSAIYTVFNSGTCSYYQLDRNYTTVTGTVTPMGMTNSSASAVAKVWLVNGTTAPTGIMLFYEIVGKTLNIYYKVDATEVLIGASTWDNNETTTYRLVGDKVTISQEGTEIISDFSLSVPLGYIGFSGDTGYWSAGYVQCDIGYGTSGMSDTITDFLPVVVAMACLGMILGAVKKMS